MNESFKTDPSQATSARAANESGSYLCASNVTPTAVRFIVSVFLCLLCSCRMSSTQMTCSHFRKNRPKKRQKPAGCRSRIISKNRPVPIFGRSTGASLVWSLFLPQDKKKVIAIICKSQNSPTKDRNARYKLRIMSFLPKQLRLWIQTLLISQFSFVFRHKIKNKKCNYNFLSHNGPFFHKTVMTRLTVISIINPLKFFFNACTFKTISPVSQTRLKTSPRLKCKS